MDKHLHWTELTGGDPPFARRDIVPYRTQPLYRSRWGQAHVSRGLLAGRDWVIKDVAANRITKFLWGRWLLSREHRAMHRLTGLPGMPAEAFRLDRDALCYRFVAGSTLRQYREDKAPLPPDFFPQLEAAVDQVHGRGVVHMDLGNTRNILVSDDTGEPRLIDFGSCVFTERLPSRLAERLQRIDRSRVYKSWAKLAPDSFDAGRAEYLASHYHRHHLKPKHWGSRMIRSMRGFFHNPTLRRGFRKTRLPLGIAFLALVMSQISAAWFWPGAMVATVGALLQAWCFACIDTQKTLADRGPYSLVRNPQYLTRFLLIIGVVLMTGNPWLLGLTAVIYYFYAVTRVEREEALLPEVFGAAYRDYCQRVPRFLPRLANLDGERLRYWNPQAFRKNHGVTNLATVALCLVLLYGWAFHVMG
ncbi:methyltransferase [Marinobacter bohaiensis]|uniref:methyltransferase n=1 Tax=Marinobacter bohaiensis TaxID=2201898 RepID=UPI000DAED244|nr:methyltransferase [Marinobacter bohaiensis]